jgi:L-lactate dehydrogenase complex protein LldE
VLGPRVREFSALLAEGEPLSGRHDATIAYHHSCHMLRELRLRDEPLRALDALDGCERVAWDGDDRCCGFGGLFSVKQPETSVAMADDKLDTLAATTATELIGCDQSCLLHLEGRLRRRGDERTVVRHLAEVLDEATATPATATPTGPATATAAPTATGTAAPRPRPTPTETPTGPANP